MAANLEFTIDECNVMHDADFFITKKKVGDKIMANFGILNAKLEEIKASVLGDQSVVELPKGKISKGENYELLPYFILDNPFVIDGSDFLAFRIMFWWGNHYSCTLHVSGNNTKLLMPVIKKRIKDPNGYYFCIAKTKWQHHFRSDNYQLIKRDSYHHILKHYDENSFTKIAFKKPLSEYESFEREVICLFTEVIIALKFKSL